MSRTIRTVNRPHEEVAVSDAEYERLLDLGLVYDGTPPVAPIDAFDSRISDRIEDASSLTRAALAPLLADSVSGAQDPFVAALVEDETSATGSALREAFVALDTIDETVTAADIPFVPTGTIAATDVQAAIAEVAAEASGAAGAVTGRIHCVANQSIVSGDNTIDFDGQAYVHGGMTSDLNANSLLAPVKGLYLVQAITRIYSNTADVYLDPAIRVNSSPVAALPSARTRAAAEVNVGGAVPLVLDAGQHVQFGLFSSAAVQASGGTGTTWMTLTLLGTLP